MHTYFSSNFAIMVPKGAKRSSRVCWENGVNYKKCVFTTPYFVYNEYKMKNHYIQIEWKMCMHQFTLIISRNLLRFSIVSKFQGKMKKSVCINQCRLFLEILTHFS